MGNELITAAQVSIVITLIGLALGFALLKLQGE
nr:photosystem I assembly protein Ycf31 [Proteomonas sp. NIES-1005]BDA98575.1 cytochrome b6-f complex subunit VII [Proteomonas sp. NEIS-1375]